VSPSPRPSPNSALRTPLLTPRPARRPPARQYLILSPNQIVAGALVIRYWNNSINGAVWVTILIVFVVAVNCLGIKWFGEVEWVAPGDNSSFAAR
jgi:hypothetical protein